MDDDVTYTGHGNGASLMLMMLPMIVQGSIININLGPFPSVVWHML
jgi:hypothetical protein